jgi:hypothetical protein
MELDDDDDDYDHETTAAVVAIVAASTWVLIGDILYETLGGYSEQVKEIHPSSLQGMS